MSDNIFKESQKHKEKFFESIRENGTFIPFIGAGVSASLGIQDWSGLINHVADELGFNEKIFSELGDYLALAEYCELNEKMDIVLAWMRKEWSDEKFKKKIGESEIYNALVSFNCKRIYTTNFDRFIETAYDKEGSKRAVPIITIDDFTKKDNRGKTQVIKLHGDLECASLVFSESSYYDRLMNPSALDFKLQSDMLDKTFLFLGYSVSDINIRRIIYMLDNLWKGNVKEEDKEKSNRPDSYIFLPKPNIVFSKILEERNIHTILGEMPLTPDQKHVNHKIDKDYRTIMIEKFLNEIQEKMDAN